MRNALLGVETGTTASKEKVMKRYSTLIVIIALFCFSVSLSAQENLAGEKNDYSKLDKREGIPLSEMTLSEDQNKKIEEIGANYGDQMLELRSQMTVKQIELKSLLRDPNASEEKILSLARDIRALNVQIQKMMIYYQMDIRKILTSEQIKTWYTLENPPAKRGRRQ